MQEWRLLGKWDRTSVRITGGFFSVCRSNTQAKSKDCTKKRKSNYKDNEIDHEVNVPFCKRFMNSVL